ncbi:MAG TPA: hypothetical protein VLS51_05935, partial [Propionibacteriaceae bacterium]|nr:hypothetical protein [Propionibacteriaceae bacterium]
TRPAMPEDLFRRPPEEQAAPPATPVPSAADPTYVLPAAPAWGAADPEATVVRPGGQPPMSAPIPPMSAPIPPYRPGSPEADLLPSERPYVAPLPPAAPERRQGNGVRGVIILLVLLVAAALVGGLIWFTGGGAPKAGSSPTKSTSVSVSPSRAASTPQGSSLPPSSPPSDAFPPSGANLCSGSTTVAVNSATSCEFAANVAAAIPSGATGSFTVTATSPVTQKDYQMNCVRGSYTVCSGGVNAVVYVK